MMEAGGAVRVTGFLCGLRAHRACVYHDMLSGPCQLLQAALAVFDAA